MIIYHLLILQFFFLHLYYTVETTCNSEVNNNITYFVSPKFPAIMPNTIESCNLKVKLLSDDISQIRLDFVHFSLVGDK